MITLEKTGDRTKIVLDKSGAEIIATARWTDNGDANGSNDDLDLRAGILFPNGKMSIVHCGDPGALQQAPFVLHTGDVKAASAAQPGQETLKVNADISVKYGGPVAIVFSVYSAVANGAVSIASLKPVMRLQYQQQIIDCALDFTKDPQALRDGVYTYVIGMAVINGQEIEIMPGGMVSEPRSEATPWLEWDKKGSPKITMDGPAVMKGGAKLVAGLLNIANKKKYEVVNPGGNSAPSGKQAKQIEELKKAYEEGFISQSDYDAKLKQLSEA